MGRAGTYKLHSEVKMYSQESADSFVWNFSDSYSYEWEGYPLSRQITVGIMVGSMILVTAVGNVMVMAAFYRDRRINRKIGNWYIVNLSVADFIVGCFSLTLTIIWELKGWWFFGETVCKIYLFVDYVTVTVPVCTIICISLDRYWLLTKKLNYPKYATKTKAVVFIVSMWTFCVVYYGIVTYAWIPITGFDEIIDYSDNCELEGTYNFPFQLFMIAFFFILPLIVIAALNLVVYLNIYQRSRGFVQSKPDASCSRKEQASVLYSREQSTTSEANLENANPGFAKSVSESTISISVQIKDQKRAKADKLDGDKKRPEFNRHRKAAITLAVLVGVFIVCWLPFYIASIVGAFCVECISHQTWFAVNYLLWGNSMINPFLYAAMNVHFRENFVKFLGLNRFKKKTPEAVKTMSTSGE